MKIGDTCWIIEYNIRITPCRIKRISGNFYMVELPSGSVINLTKHRIYQTYEQAEQKIPKKLIRRNPYDYMR